MLLMKVASKALSLSFNEFCVLVYAFIYFSLYCFIRKYSADYGLSVLIFTCYTFFIFFLTGLRNAIAIAICLWAFDCLMRRTRGGVVVYFMLALIASTIHTSALIFLLAYPLSRYKPDIRVSLVLIAAAAVALLFRGHIFSYINSTFRDVGAAGTLSMGGSSFLLIGLSVFSLVSVAMERTVGATKKGEPAILRIDTPMCTLLCLLGLC